VGKTELQQGEVTDFADGLTELQQGEVTDFALDGPYPVPRTLYPVSRTPYPSPRTELHCIGNILLTLDTKIKGTLLVLMESES
jgi:hypothetical protein